MQETKAQHLVFCLRSQVRHRDNEQVLVGTSQSRTNIFVVAGFEHLALSAVDGEDYEADVVQQTSPLVAFEFVDEVGQVFFAAVA